MAASAIDAPTLESVQVSTPVQTAPPVAALLSVEEWVQSLSYWQFNLLQPSDVQYLKAAQIASIPSASYLAAMSAPSRGALSATQVQSLSIANVGIKLLTTSQVAALTVAQIQQVNYPELSLVPANRVPSLTTTQIASIPSVSYFVEWSSAARGALTMTQVRALQAGETRINLLTPTQVSWLTTAQIRTLKAYDFEYLAPNQIPLLTAAQTATISTSGLLAAWSDQSRAALTQPQVQSLDTANVRISLLTPAQITWLTTTQIQKVNYYDFERLSASQIPSLTPAQVATIPTAGSLAAWAPASIAALTQAQVPALKVGETRIHLLTPTQVSWLTTAQIRTLKVYDFEHLAPNQVPLLTAAQTSTISTSGLLAAWSEQARAALTQVQVQSLDTANVRISLLTPTQITWLTTAQIQKVSYYDFARLSALQTPSLTTAQIASIPGVSYFVEWSAAARGALTMTQVRALQAGETRINLLTPTQVGWLTAAQIRTLKVYDFEFLAPNQVPSLTAEQTSTISTSGFLAAWSEQSRAALTRTQVQSLDTANVRISLLTPTQITWLTTAQIQKVSYYDFGRLSALQIPSLTTAQVASIPSVSYFVEWPSAARGALTQPQIGALQVAETRINLLTPTQVGWLTISQIRTLKAYDFEYLAPNQIPALTTAQTSTISTTGLLAAWSDQARAALTPMQVQSLDTANVRINLLTPAQVGWLTTAQIQKLGYYDFEFLLPSQIPFITHEQFRNMPGGYIILNLPDASQAALTREQLLNMPSSYWEYLGRISPAEVPPTNYVPVVQIPTDSNGMATNPHMTMEADRFFALVPIEAATHRAIASGNWSDPAIWLNRAVPGAGAKAYIPAGMTVRFDAYMTSAIKTLRVDGTLTFAVDRDTQLKADTVVIYTSGKLHIGTASAPIQDHVTARVLIADGGAIDRSWDPYAMSRGLISRGEVRMYGKEVTPYVELLVAPTKGDTQLRLASVPKNWKVGDEITLTGNQPNWNDFGTESVRILAINGSTVTVEPLRYDHSVPAAMASAYVANMTRNIEFVAEDDSVVAERPHMVFLHNPNVQIANISVQGFGRTDKSIPINDPVVVNGVLQAGTGTNPRARYAMHFHHTGVNPVFAAAVVSGSVIQGSPGWGMVNHSSNVAMLNNIAYGVAGAAFVTEDGNEIGIMRGNLAMNSTGVADGILSRRESHDYGFNGHGFWFQGPGVEVVDNIAAGSLSAAFVYYTASSKNLFDAVNLTDRSLAAGLLAVPVGAVPLKKFSGNAAIASGIGLEVWHHQPLMTDGQSYIENFSAWSNRRSGISMHYSGQITVRGGTLIGDLQNFTETGIATNWGTQNITFENVGIFGYEVGIDVPVRRSTVINGGTIWAIQALYIEKGHDTIRSVDIKGNISFLPIDGAGLRGRTQSRVYLDGTFDFTNNNFVGRRIESLFSADKIRFAPNGSTPLQLYYVEQHPLYVPFTTANSRGYLPDSILNRGNFMMWQVQLYSFGGKFTPNDVSTVSGIRALARPTV